MVYTFKTAADEEPIRAVVTPSNVSIETGALNDAAMILERLSAHIVYKTADVFWQMLYNAKKRLEAELQQAIRG